MCQATTRKKRARAREKESESESERERDREREGRVQLVKEDLGDATCDLPHTACWQYARRKVMPVAASLSMLGVMACV